MEIDTDLLTGRPHYGNTGWGYYMQGNDDQQEIEGVGATLSKILGCPVHYPAFGKKMYECKCGILFPHYFVAGHSNEEIVRFHENGGHL